MMWALLLLACGEGKTEDAQDADDTATPLPEQCDAQWDAWASGFFTTYCQSCHSETSPHATGTIGLDLTTCGTCGGGTSGFVSLKRMMPMGVVCPRRTLTVSTPGSTAWRAPMIWLFSRALRANRA